MLTGMIAMILLRALHKDIARYNSLADEDGAQEDFGWKLVHADVFRPPYQRMLLAIMIGNGAQMLCMTAVTLGMSLESCEKCSQMDDPVDNGHINNGSICRVGFPVS